MGLFTKETVTKEIVERVDAYGPGSAIMSVKDVGYSGLKLVVGAAYDSRQSCLFSEQTLGQLIEELKDIHSAMKDFK